MRDPAELSDTHISQFLQHLVTHRKVSASTQNQALNALVFFYKRVLGREMKGSIAFTRSKKPRRLPTVLTVDEVRLLFSHIYSPVPLLMAHLLYGCGMRLMECVRLRILDLDFGYQQILIRNGKGNKDRVVLIPDSLVTALQAQLDVVRTLHTGDIERGFGSVYLPDALSVERDDQYFFPSHLDRYVNARHNSPGAGTKPCNEERETGIEASVARC